MVVVGLVVAIVASGHAECADVKLPAMNEQRVVDVLLDDASFLRGAGAFRNDAYKFIPFFSHLDADAPVRALTWLGDPDVIRVVMFFIIRFEC